MARIRLKELAYEPTVNAELLGKQDDALRSHPVQSQSPWDKGYWDGSEHESPMDRQVAGSFDRGPSVRMKESLKDALWPPPPTSDATLIQNGSQHDASEPEIKLEEENIVVASPVCPSCRQLDKETQQLNEKIAKMTQYCNQLRQKASDAMHEVKRAIWVAENTFRTAREWDPSLPDRFGRRSTVTPWAAVEALQTLTLRWRYQIEWYHREFPGLQEQYEAAHPMLFDGKEFEF
ncbi:hypothetical protein ACJ41O_000993 [Fusarium nematophilum]